jgi:hypothetical protein
VTFPEVPEGHAAATRPGQHVVKEGEHARVSVILGETVVPGSVLKPGDVVYWLSGDVVPAAWINEKETE